MNEYLALQQAELLHHLERVTNEIIVLILEIADMEADEVRERAAALQESSSTTVTGRWHDVYKRTVLPAATGVELRGKRDALNEEKAFILRILECRRR